MKGSTVERFWARVEKTEGGCWVWKGIRKYGYGAFVPVEGFHQVAAHRFAYEACVARIPPGMCVLHKCDNPPCVNPEHLFLGTHADNVADKVRKGRQPRGSDIGTSKLTEDKVRRMRKLYETKLCTTKELARLFGVRQPSVWKIVNRESWEWLD